MRTLAGVIVHIMGAIPAVHILREMQDWICRAETGKDSDPWLDAKGFVQVFGAGHSWEEALRRGST